MLTLLQTLAGPMVGKALGYDSGGMLGGGGGLLGIAGNPFISAVAQDDDLRDTLFDMLSRRNPVGLTNEMLMPSSVAQSPVGIFNQGTML